MVALSFTLFVLFASTTAYLVTTLLSAQITILNLFIDSPSVVWGMPSNVVFETLSSVRLPDYNQLQGCTSTAALTINVCSLFAILSFVY